MNFSGYLGNKDTLPGRFLPGRGPYVAPLSTPNPYSSVLALTAFPPGKIALGSVSTIKTIGETVTVTTQADAAVDQGPWKRLTQSITVSQTIIAVRDKPESISDSITISTTQVPSYSPFAYVTQFVPEVVYQTTGYARLTQFVVEVVYKKATAESVTDNITITSTPGTQFRSVHQTVTSAISVTPSLTPRDTINRQSVTHNISVAQTLYEHPNIVHEYLTQAIAVASTPAGRNNNVRLSVVTAINISVPNSERDVNNRQTTSHGLTVTPTVNEYINPDRLRVSDSITVGTTIAVVNPNHALVSNISVTTTVLPRSTVVRLAVTSNITVTTTVSPHTNPTRIEVIDNIHVIMNYPDPIWVHVTPIKLGLTDTLTVTGDLEGGAPKRPMSVTDTISVSTSITAKQIYFLVHDNITVSPTVWAGDSHRVVSVTDSILVYDNIAEYPNPRRMSVTDQIFLYTNRKGQGPRNQQNIADGIYVLTTANARVVSPQHVVDQISVEPFITPSPSINRQSVSDAIQVSQALRWSPIRESVADSITVGQRLAQFEIGVTSRITVSQAFHKNFDETVVDSLPITSTVDRKVIFGRGLMDTVPITEELSRTMDWGRAFTDTLEFAVGEYPKYVDFEDGPVYVPVAVGTLVSNHVTLQSKNGVITLPAPQLGDEKGNVAKMLIQRSMNAKTIAFKQSSTRQKLKYIFRVDKAKAFELRAFLEANISEVITMTTWDGAVWLVYLTNNPFELQNAGRSAPADEFSTIELDFEGTKLSG